jgi:hypothetical protein
VFVILNLCSREVQVFPIFSHNVHEVVEVIARSLPDLKKHGYYLEDCFVVDTPDLTPGCSVVAHSFNSNGGYYP